MTSRRTLDQRPVIGLTLDLENETYRLKRTYVRAVRDAGGVPILLPHEPGLTDEWIDLCDAFILTGGDDPRMECFGVVTHPEAKIIHPDRQESELGILCRLDLSPEKPVLGVCLGMQLMALHRGGKFEQHLPDVLPSAMSHRFDAVHPVEGPLFRGDVTSHHRQAITDPGSLCIGARAPDGVIESVYDPARRFYVGVQWHPERTRDESVGSGVFRRLVDAARR